MVSATCLQDVKSDPTDQMLSGVLQTQVFDGVSKLRFSKNSRRMPVKAVQGAILRHVREGQRFDSRPEKVRLFAGQQPSDRGLGDAVDHEPKVQVR